MTDFTKGFIAGFFVGAGIVGFVLTIYSIATILNIDKRVEIGLRNVLSGYEVTIINE